MSDLTVALAASDAAAECALEFYEAGVEATAKNDGSPVTQADLAVESLLRQALQRERLDDAVLGEENGLQGASSRVWIVDPIDGTGLFARHDPNWRVQVCLQVDGITQLSVVTAPAMGVRWWAARGTGTFETRWDHGSVGPVRKLELPTRNPTRPLVLEALTSKSDPVAPQGYVPPSSALPLVGLLHGEVDAFLVERYFAWDHAPWILLVEEAGGRFTNPVGDVRADQGGGLYSISSIHDELIRARGYSPRHDR